jgi:hypothetical protein
MGASQERKKREENDDGNPSLCGGDHGRPPASAPGPVFPREKLAQRKGDEKKNGAFPVLTKGKKWIYFFRLSLSLNQLIEDRAFFVKVSCGNKDREK